MSKDRRSVVLALLAIFLPLALLLPTGVASAADPIVVPDPTINGCNGVLPTPGSENTHKRLDPNFASDFNPGGVVGYIVDFPVTASEVGGDFEITDCVYVDPPGAGTDAPIAKYFVHFVPNNEDFHLQFSVPIPANTPLGSQFCNYAKTTGPVTAGPASNRKAGPACFTVGGGLRIEKRSGSAEGPLLNGASFSVVCSPTTTSPPTIITGLSNQSQTNPNGTVSASGNSDDGTVAINGPSGTPCVVTETAAPPGYQVDSTPRNLVIPVGTSQTVNVFVNEQLGSLSVSKHAVGAGGTFHFTVSCDDGETYAPFDMTVAAGDTDTHLVSDQIEVGTECTVTESANALFSTTAVPANRKATVDANGETVAFTNTRLAGSLVVAKSADQDGTFQFDVDCTNDAYDTTLGITTSGGSGSASISGIPTGVECTVTEQSNPLFSTVVVPGDGTVTISTGDNTVSFTNTRARGALVVDKSANVDGTFTFDVDCDGEAFDTTLQITTSGGSGSASISGIPTGVECTVSEQSNALFSTVVVPGDGTVTIGTGENTVSFTNTRLTGSLVVNKSTDVDGTFTFDVDCDGEAFDTTLQITTSGGAGSASISGIPTGVECTVSEQSNPLFSSVVVPADGTVTIGTGDNTVAFTNSRLRGGLEIDKTTDVDGTFTFDLDCTDDTFDTTGLTITTQQGVGSLLIDGIPTGTECTAEEIHDATWAVVVTPENGTATISEGTTTVAFNNTKLFTDVTFAKAADPASGSPVTDGDTITYTVSYANSGNIAADIAITDTIPEGTTLVEGSAGDGVLTEDTLSWEVTVPAEGSGEVSFAVTVNDGLTDPFTIRNVALGHEGDTETPTNETEHPVAHVVITKTVDQDSAAYGDELTYTLTITNPSAADLTDVVVTDPVPDGTTFVSASDGGTCDDPCTTVSWPAVELASGDSLERTFVVRIDTPTPAADGAVPATEIVNVGAVDAAETAKEPSNEARTTVVEVLGVAIVRPPAGPLPVTGLQLPVGLALGLLFASAALLLASRRWHND